MNRLRLLVGLAVLLCAGCTTSEPARNSSAAVPVVPVYRLAADDKVKVVVYGEDDLSGQYLVGSDGNLSFPLIGMVKATGMTLAELQDALAKRLGAGFLNSPKVSADIVEYRPFYILGEVNKAGQYPYRIGLTINAAVATAGGFTYRANHKEIAIQHVGGVEERYQLTSDALVAPGDTIRVLERFF